jgi:hypothetical protein
MRVRYLTLSAGPDGVIQPGDVRDVPEVWALALIAAGSAVAVDAPRTRQEPVQTAIAKPEEKAVTHEPQSTHRPGGNARNRGRGKGSPARRT